MITVVYINHLAPDIVSTSFIDKVYLQSSTKIAFTSAHTSANEWLFPSTKNSHPPVIKRIQDKIDTHKRMNLYIFIGYSVLIEYYR